MNKDNGIRYKQVIDLGFKRKDLGGDQVFYDRHGYDWFIASKTLVKEQGCKIIANWHPETQEIEVLYLNKKRDVISRQRFSGQHGLARYRAIQLFFKPKPQSIQYRPFVLADTGAFALGETREAENAIHGAYLQGKPYASFQKQADALRYAAEAIEKLRKRTPNN